MAQSAPPDFSWRPTGAPELTFTTVLKRGGTNRAGIFAKPQGNRLPCQALRYRRKTGGPLALGPERPLRLLVTTNRCSRITLPEASHRRTPPTWPRAPLQIARDDQQVLQNSASRGLRPADLFSKGWVARMSVRADSLLRLEPFYLGATMSFAPR